MSLPEAVLCPSCVSSLTQSIRSILSLNEMGLCRSALLSRLHSCSFICVLSVSHQAQLVHLDGQIVIRASTPFIKITKDELLSSSSQASFN